jgi:ribosomal protein L37AE/L43A
MGRKKNCPKCGSKKNTVKNNIMKCNTCGTEFSGKSRGRTSKQEKRQW